MSSGTLRHKKQRDLDNLEREVALNLFRTSDRFQIRFTRLLREHGLTSSQYNVLRILRDEGRPMPILEIASKTIAVVPGITGLIDRLEKAELVVRERSEEDRRVVRVNITPKARILLENLDQPLAELHRRLLSHMDKSELVELSRLLEKVRQGLAEGSSDEIDPVDRH
ncbi:transcriptional regulator, MarR family [Isosphaera pallida ATCC 43644]|uniref:Transcriptional regulator, MarR family n=1 Tax=Isosphaera pallida (strain ATCC 43644 / DSM 9630 / IS1B) TaxID=575540 RepID=E8QY89_ISOPI|nr:MarR family transcriptional regulator [Isosphaera pallida]ADV63084.1 transcriptional regulator, MarR family [Isosphaera pallida ATCC 43644]